MKRLLIALVACSVLAGCDNSEPLSGTHTYSCVVRDKSDQGDISRMGYMLTVNLSNPKKILANGEEFTQSRSIAFADGAMYTFTRDNSAKSISIDTEQSPKLYAIKYLATNLFNSEVKKNVDIWSEAYDMATENFSSFHWVNGAGMGTGYYTTCRIAN